MASVPVCWRGGSFVPRQDKVEQVELLTEKLKSAKVAVLTDYRGLTVSQGEGKQRLVRDN